MSVDTRMRQMASAKFGPPDEVVQSIFNVNPEALEQIAQFIEQRGLRIPVGQVVGYQRERFVCLIEKSGTQSIPDSTQTNLTFDTTDADDQKAFDGTSTVTLPYNGIYIVTGYVAWAANTTGSRQHVVLQNGVSRAQDWRAATATAADGAQSTVSSPINGKKGDTIKHAVFQDSGGALNVLASSNLQVALISAY